MIKNMVKKSGGKKTHKNKKKKWCPEKCWAHTD